MAGILDSFFTPQNVERGVNLLQSNKGIVSGLAQNLTFLPASLRAYTQSLAGSQTPIILEYLAGVMCCFLSASNAAANTSDLF